MRRKLMGVATNWEELDSVTWFKGEEWKPFSGIFAEYVT